MEVSGYACCGERVPREGRNPSDHHAVNGEAHGVRSRERERLHEAGVHPRLVRVGGRGHIGLEEVDLLAHHARTLELRPRERACDGLTGHLCERLAHGEREVRQSHVVLDHLQRLHRSRRREDEGVTDALDGTGQPRIVAVDPRSRVPAQEVGGHARAVWGVAHARDTGERHRLREGNVHAPHQRHRCRRARVVHELHGCLGGKGLRVQRHPVEVRLGLQVGEFVARRAGGSPVYVVLREDHLPGRARPREVPRGQPRGGRKVGVGVTRYRGEVRAEPETHEGPFGRAGDGRQEQRVGVGRRERPKFPRGTCDVGFGVVPHRLPCAKRKEGGVELHLAVRHAHHGIGRRPAERIRSRGRVGVRHHLDERHDCRRVGSHAHADEGILVGVRRVAGEVVPHREAGGLRPEGVHRVRDKRAKVQHGLSLEGCPPPARAVPPEAVERSVIARPPIAHPSENVLDGGDAVPTVGREPPAQQRERGCVEHHLARRHVLRSENCRDGGVRVPSRQHERGHRVDGAAPRVLDREGVRAVRVRRRGRGERVGDRQRARNSRDVVRVPFDGVVGRLDRRERAVVRCPQEVLCPCVRAEEHGCTVGVCEGFGGTPRRLQTRGVAREGLMVAVNPRGRLARALRVSGRHAGRAKNVAVEVEAHHTTLEELLPTAGRGEGTPVTIPGTREAPVIARVDNPDANPPANRIPV